MIGIKVYLRHIYSISCQQPTFHLASSSFSAALFAYFASINFRNHISPKNNSLHGKADSNYSLPTSKSTSSTSNAPSSALHAHHKSQLFLNTVSSTEFCGVSPILHLCAIIPSLCCSLPENIHIDCGS